MERGHLVRSALGSVDHRTVNPELLLNASGGQDVRAPLRLTFFLRNINQPPSL